MLMAKTAENRYQTALGLKYDLELARKEEPSKSIVLGTKDFLMNLKLLKNFMVAQKIS